MFGDGNSFPLPRADNYGLGQADSGLARILYATCVALLSLIDS